MSTRQKALAIACLAAANIIAWIFPHGIVRAAGRFEPERIPLILAGFRGADVPVPESVPRLLGATSVMNRRYRSPAGTEVELFTAFYSQQELGRQPHDPEACLLGGGWTFGEERRITLPVRDPISDDAVTVKELRAEHSGWSLTVLSFHINPRATFPTAVAAKVDRIADSILRFRRDALFVRLLVKAKGPRTDDEALYGFARRAVPAVYEAYERD